MFSAYAYTMISAYAHKETSAYQNALNGDLRLCVQKRLNEVTRFLGLLILRCGSIHFSHEHDRARPAIFQQMNTEDEHFKKLSCARVHGCVWHVQLPLQDTII